MSQSYQAIGINLKAVPLGESDKLVTVLTPHFGIVRAIAPGARKPKSRLRGRTEIFVVNDLLLVRGRSLDKLIQADTITSYPGLSQHLGKLAIAQYWAEIVLTLELSDASHAPLYTQLCQGLHTVAALPPPSTLSTYLGTLIAGIWPLLTWAGIAPSGFHCGLTQQPITPAIAAPNWRVGMSFELGRLLLLPTAEPVVIDGYLSAAEVLLLQALQVGQSPAPETVPLLAWRSLERILRHYCQYHLGRAIRSAALLDTLFEEDF